MKNTAELHWKLKKLKKNQKKKDKTALLCKIDPHKCCNSAIVQLNCCLCNPSAEVTRLYLLSKLGLSNFVRTAIISGDFTKQKVSRAQMERTVQESNIQVACQCRQQQDHTEEKNSKKKFQHQLYHS